MQGIYIGDTKSLVFPVMCNGYLYLDYENSIVSDSDNVAKHSGSTELALRSGLWGHTNSFAIEAVITPYDVNGYGTKTGTDINGKTDSIKTVPSIQKGQSNLTNYQSERYFSDRYAQKLTLFYNSNFHFYLENTTKNNVNQPAEYKLVVKVTSTNNVSQEVKSNTAIKALNTIYGYYDIDALYSGNSTSLRKLSDTSSWSGSSIVYTDTDAPDKISIGASNGTIIYDSSGVELGTVTAVNTGTTTFTISNSVSGSGAIYYSQPKEALYIENIYKVGCAYSKNGTLTLYLNNEIIAQEVITDSAFEFSPTDCFIGQNGSNVNTQFMGELYEIAMYAGTENTPTLVTISAGYGDIIFYYRFGE